MKTQFSTAFFPQIDCLTEKQNSKIEVYLQVLVNYKQNNWAKLLLIAKFIYNNAKNLSSGYTLFELYYSYYPYVIFDEDINLQYKSKPAKKLSAKLH